MIQPDEWLIVKEQEVVTGRPGAVPRWCLCSSINNRPIVDAAVSLSLFCFWSGGEMIQALMFPWRTQRFPALTEESNTKFGCSAASFVIIQLPSCLFPFNLHSSGRVCVLLMALRDSLHSNGTTGVFNQRAQPHYYLHREEEELFPHDKVYHTPLMKDISGAAVEITWAVFKKLQVSGEEIRLFSVNKSSSSEFRRHQSFSDRCRCDNVCVLSRVAYLWKLSSHLPASLHTQHSFCSGAPGLNPLLSWLSWLSFKHPAGTESDKEQDPVCPRIRGWAQPQVTSERALSNNQETEEREREPGGF